ncbi:MAG TPA: (S)-ureidoglycine aminohydrolase [Acidobacteriaceae bacterium]|nr:(S)-ureidoglycine aminohydrolase [Acidobacteriaceae bacterium]
MHNLGQTRSSNQRDHLLHTPDAFVRSPLPGLARGNAIVHISPAAGAAFTQYTAELEPGGSLEPASVQRFVYVLEGEIDLSTEFVLHSLGAGGYAYLPVRSTYLIAAKTAARVAVIEKPYQALEETPAPEMIVGREAEIAPTALNGDPDLEVRALLPGEAGFDFAVNTMTYQPGAALSQVEVHVMEHGLLMLEGGGIYRLGDAWYPVTAGDFIWMGPYCPQWFGALGKQPAKYLIYKDWNRHPLGSAMAGPR